MRSSLVLGRMLDVLKLRSGKRRFGSLAQDELLKVSLIVNLVNELVDAGWGVSSAALERLGCDDLAIVDHEFLVE